MAILTLAAAQAYARGYYLGRTIGVEECESWQSEEYRHYYRLGYDRGVADSEFDGNPAYEEYHTSL